MHSTNVVKHIFIEYSGVRAISNSVIATSSLRAQEGSQCGRSGSSEIRGTVIDEGYRML